MDKGEVKDILIIIGIFICIIILTVLILSLIPCDTCGAIKLVNTTLLK